MLIKTIDEVKAVLPKLISNLNDDSLLPNFDTVEEKYLVPLIGDALYDDLQTKYDANGLSADETTLLKHMQLVIGAYGLADEQIASHVFITDDGIRVSGNESMPKAARWEFEKLQRYLQDRALDGTEVLLKYMWKKKADLDLWTASDAYKQFEDLLIRTGTDFNEHYGLLQPMRTFYAMRSILKQAQKNYIVSGFGADLTAYLVKLAAPSDEEKEIIDALKSALANFTIKHACEKFRVQFSSAGFTVISDFGGDRDSEEAGKATATRQDVADYKAVCDRDGKNFASAAKKLCVALRADAAAPAAFVTAFDAGPLTKYVDPKETKSGNERRKIFRT